MKLLVSWILLLFGVSLSTSHYIRRIEDGDSSVYSIKDEPAGITIVSSKPGKPTLREVLYYHIVERAYGKEEPAGTERSFTNSHGLQFLKEPDESSAESPEHGDEYEERHDENDEHEEVEEHHENKLEDEIGDGKEEETESTTEHKQLTDKDVKEAYKARSYLFDQMRQRYLPVKRMVPSDSPSRRKRDTESEAIPDAPQLSSESSKEDYSQPKTYGMNLNPAGGYVWNNLNNPPTYYEVGQSPAGTPTEGQNESGQIEENKPTETDDKAPQVTETNPSDSSEDIYVSTDRQPAEPSETQEVSTTEEKEPESEPEVIESGEPADNPIAPVIYENESPQGESENVSAEPVLNDDSASEDLNPGVQKPVLDSSENPSSGSEEAAEPQFEKPAEEGLDNGSTESSDGDKIKDIPEAPTLPPLNYDNLPDYIRDAISSTEKAESIEQTENPYVNPQLDPEDKKTVEDKMEEIFATVQTVEDIPKTYGMNLTNDGGHVWNDMVNPPVSYDVGTTDNGQKEEPKAPEPTEETKPVEEQPEKVAEPEDKPVNPEDKTEVPETTDLEVPANPEPVPENVEKPSESAEDKPAEPIQPEPEVSSETIEPVEPVIPDVPEVTVPEPGSPEIEEPSKTDDGASTEVVDQPAEQKPEEDKKTDIMSELLKSEQFWKWLGEWTATYMELVEKHVRKIAIQEICKHEKSGAQMCLLDDQPEDGPIIKDGKIVIDGKEIPITLTDLDNQLKRGNKDKDRGSKIDANTIYGNSVGNEKVTNVFIFNADNAKEILEEFKPGNDTKVDFIIDERGKDTTVKDETKPKIEGEVVEESKVEDVSIDKGEAIEDQKDKSKEDKEAKVIEVEPKIAQDDVSTEEAEDKLIDKDLVTEDEKILEEKTESSELEDGKESSEKTLALEE